MRFRMRAREKKSNSISNPLLRNVIYTAAVYQFFLMLRWAREKCVSPLRHDEESAACSKKKNVSHK